MLKAKYNRSEGQEHCSSLKKKRAACYKGTDDTPSSTFGSRGELHVWFLCSCTALAFERIGVVVFSLLTNRLRKRWSFGVVSLGSMMVLGLLTALMAFTHWYPSVLVIWALRGGTDVLFLISAYSMTQLIVPNALLGRVITFTRVLTWPTGSLGVLLGGLAIVQTGNVGLVYGSVGLLVFLVAFAFWFTPLGHAERYVPEAEAAQGG